jgi:hypothetical protein
MTVDDAGVIHVIFYDERIYDGLDSNDQEDGTADAKFDVYYSYSLDGGLTFSADRRLHEGEDAGSEIPALDELGGNGNLAKPGEYIGIAYDPIFDRILTSYTGIDADDPHPNQSVIWFSLIRPAQ